MLKIEIAGQAIDLFPDSSVAWELKNPMFEDTGSHSWTMSLPETPANKKIFGFPARLTKATLMQADVPFSLYHSGLLLFIGTATVKETKKGTIEVYFKTGSGDLNNNIKDKSLRDFEYGGSLLSYFNTPALQSYLLAQSADIFPTSKVAVFPLKNEGQSLNGPPTDAWIEQNDRYTQNSFETTWTPIPGGAATNAFTFNSNIFPYLAHVLPYILNETGFMLQNDPFLFYPELKRLCIVTNNEQPFLIWPGPTMELKVKNFMPGSNASELFIGLKSLFGLLFFANHNSGRVVSMFWKEIFASADLEDWTDKSLKTIETSIEELVHLSYKFEADGADGYYSTRVKEIDPAKVLSSAANYASLPSTGNFIGDLRLVTSEDVYYEWVFINEETGTMQWSFFSININKNLGKGDSISSKISPVIQNHWLRSTKNTTYNPYDYYLRITDFFTPRMDMKVNKKGERTECGIRFAFYRGYQNVQENFFHYVIGTPSAVGSLNTPVPFGTHDVYAPDGTKIPEANLALKWDGQYGLYENFWKEYAEWHATRRRMVTRYIMLTAADLASLKMYRKVRIDGVNFFIKSISVTIKTNGIMPAKVEMYTA